MGRHREFDLDATLEAALRVFWEKGYEGTSYDDLTAATGVVRPGLYSAYGNKEALFLKAIDRYDSTYTAFMGEALAAPNAKDVAKQVLEGSAELVTTYPTSPGCLITNNALCFSDTNAHLRDELMSRRNAAQLSLQARFERAKAEGDLDEHADCKMLANYVMALTHGFAVQAKAGVPKATLMAIARHALDVWQSPAGASKSKSAGGMRRAHPSRRST